MKQNKLTKYFLTTAFAIFALFACNVPDDNTELIPFVPEEVTNPETLSQFIIANPELSTLERALRLIETEGDLKIITQLNVPGNSTVFAPSNAAFDAFLEANGIDDIADVPLESLTNVILYHVLEGEFKAADLTTGYVTTLGKFETRIGRTDVENNLSLYINTAEGVTLNRDTNVVTPDIDANNGVIHIVDKVIGLPTIANLIGVNPALSNYIAAVRRADSFVNEEGETPNSIERTLRNQGGLVTVFIPTNEAFSNYLTERDATGETTLEDIDETELARITKTHIISSYLSSDRLESGLVSTIQTDSPIMIDVPTLTITDPQNRTAKINSNQLDIQGVNGVMHYIDNVLLPSDPPEEDM